VIVLDCVQGSPEWVAARRGIPTASEFGRIITPKTGKLAAASEAYIAELIDELVRPDAERGFSGNRHTERGKALEPEARDWYAFSADGDVRQVGLCLTDDRMAGCSPDALVGEDGGCEIKSPDGPAHVRYLLAGVLPDEYKAQVHGCMWVTGRAQWHFVSWCPPYRPLLVRVDRDGYTDLLGQAVGEFCAELARARDQILGAAA
jgi:hypothetical protein